MENDFPGLLLRLAENISDKDFKNLKFLCSKYISKSRLEIIKDTLDLFDELKSRRIIGEKKLQELKDLLDKATNGKKSLIELINEYENKFCKVPDSCSKDTNAAAALSRVKNLKEECTFLTNNLGKDWKFFMRELNVPDTEIDYYEEVSPRQVKETIYACLRYWIREVVPPHQTAEKAKTELVEALKRMERNDLVYKLQSMQSHSPNEG